MSRADSTSNSSGIALAGSALCRVVGVAAKASEEKGYDTVEEGNAERGRVEGERWRDAEGEQRRRERERNWSPASGERGATLREERMEKRRGHIPSSSIHRAENHRRTFRGAPTRGEREGEPGEERNCREREEAERSAGLYEIKTKSMGKHIVSFETDWHTRQSLTPSLSHPPPAAFLADRRRRRRPLYLGPLFCFSFPAVFLFVVYYRAVWRVYSFEAREIMQTSTRQCARYAKST